MSFSVMNFKKMFSVSAGISLMLIAGVQELSAQTLSGFGTMIDLSEKYGRMHIRTGEQLKDGAIMEPYLSEEFRRGSITLTNGNTLEGGLRYNVLDETIEFMGTDQAYPWNLVAKFSWTNPETGKVEEWENIKKIWPAFEYGGFGRKLNDFLIAKYFMDYIAPTRSQTIDVGDPSAYYRAALYHYAILDGKLIELPKGKNEFFRMFGDWEKVMRKHAQKEKLKHTESEHIANLLTAYNKIKK